MKKMLFLLICSVVMMAALAGCGSTGEPSSQSKAKKGGKHEALLATSFHSYITEDFIAKFHEEYPEVEIEINSYAGGSGSGYSLHSLERGDIPDIYVSTQNFAPDAQEKYLLDLSNYDFVNNYSNALLDAQDVNGGIYLLTSGYQLTGMYYNKTILKENGWELPKSFEELLELSEKIEAAGYRTMGHAMSLDGYPFNYFFNIGNTAYFGTPKGTEWKEEFPKGEAKAAGNSELKKAAEYFNRWVEHGFITTENMEAAQFMEGESVFFLCLGINEYEHTTQEGTTYEFGIMPWLSEDGSSNMLTRTTSLYIGLNKSLAEKGNEQKLEDALKLMRYISTVEGQQVLMAGSNYYVLSLSEGEIAEDSPYQAVEDLVEDGRTVPLLYVGWEKQIIPIAQDIKQLISKETDVDGMLAAFDKTNEDLLKGASEDIYATVPERLTLEETAKLVAIAEGKAVEADCAMVSLNQYHEGGFFNNKGLGWYLYEGELDRDVINIFRPKSNTIAVVELTGADIKGMQEAGFDLNDNGNPYEYLLFTKGDMELEDATTYKLAISIGELKETTLGDVTEVEIAPADAIEAYVKELGTVSADALIWE